MTLHSEGFADRELETLGRAKNLQRLSVAIWGWRYQDNISQLGVVLANKALFVELKQVLFKWRSERWGDLSHYLDQLKGMLGHLEIEIGIDCSCDFV